MAFDYQGAKAAGYTDEEINQYLQTKQTTPQATTIPRGAVTQASQQVQSAGGFDPMKTLEGAYKFLVPQSIRENLEPRTEGLARSLAMLPRAIDQAGYNPLRGNVLPQITPQERSQFATDYADYVKRTDELKKITDAQVRDPKQYLAMAGDIGMYKLPIPIMNQLSKALGPGLKSWFISRGAAGALPSFLQGITRPQDKTIEDRLVRGISQAPMGAGSMIALSGLLEAVPVLGKLIKGEGEYMYGKTASVLKGKNLGEASYQEKVNKTMLDLVKGNRPETIAKNSQKLVNETAKQVDDILSQTGNIVKGSQIDDTLSQTLTDFKTNDPATDKLLSNAFVRAKQEILRYFSPTKMGPGKMDFQGSAGGLLQGKQALGNHMTELGSWKRLDAGEGTLTDFMLKKMYDQTKDMIDDAVQSSTLDPVKKGAVSELTNRMHMVIDGGLAMLNTARGQTGKVTTQSVTRGIPFLSQVGNYLQTAETAGIKGMRGAGKALENTKPLLDFIQKVAPGLMLQNKFRNEEGYNSPTTPQTIDSAAPGVNPAMADEATMNPTTDMGPADLRIKVLNKQTGQTGTIPVEEFDPRLYEFLE